jgi:hypothetical protein
MSLLSDVLPIMEVCIDSTLASTSSLAFSSSDFFSFQAATALARTIERIAPFAASNPDLSFGDRIITLLSKLARINAAILQDDESPVSIAGTRIQLLIQKVASYAIFTTQQGSTVSVNSTVAVTVEVITWADGDFPFDTQLHGVVIVSVTLTPTGVVTGPSASSVIVVESALVSSPTSCGRFSQETHVWSTSGCTLTPLSTAPAGPTYRCECVATVGGGIVHLGFLFGLNDEPVTDNSSNAGLAPGAIAAIVVISIIVVVVAGFALAVRFNPRVRSVVMPFFERRRNAESTERDTSMRQHTMQMMERNTMQWKKGEKGEL